MDETKNGGPQPGPENPAAPVCERCKAAIVGEPYKCEPCGYKALCALCYPGHGVSRFLAELMQKPIVQSTVFNGGQLIPQTTLHRTEAPHSVELSLTAAGKVSGSVKVYDADPDKALERAAAIFDKLRAKYPAS